MKKRFAKPAPNLLPTPEDLAWEDQFMRDNHAMITAKLQEAYDSVARGEEPVQIESLEHFLLIARGNRSAQLKMKP